MEEKEFINWFKGFIQGAHEFNITPKQWQEVKEITGKVGNKPDDLYVLDTNIWTINFT